MRTRLKLPASNPAMTHVLASNFPDAIEQVCELDVSQASGPVFAALHQSSAPLMVRLSADAGGNAAPLRDVKRDIDPANWLGQTNVLFPLLGTQNDRCVVGFHGKGLLPNASHFAELALLASGLFARFCELGKVERIDLPVLSGKWSACVGHPQAKPAMKWLSFCRYRSIQLITTSRWPAESSTLSTAFRPWPLPFG